MVNLLQSFLLICLLISVSQAEVHLIGPVDQGRLFVASELRPSPLPAKLTGRLDLPNDPMLSAQWYLLNFGQRSEKGVSGFAGADIHLFSALQYFRPQRQVTVAVIDSGIDLTHEDVSKDVLWVNSGEIAGNGIDDDGNGYIDDVHGLNFTAQTHDVQDKHYHGTHVTSLLSAATHNSRGIAGAMPWLRIMPVVIFGLGTTASGDQIAEGIRYACDHGAKVLSNSWGSRNANPKMLEAIQYCDSLGVLFVNAAGNSRENVDSTPQYPTNYQVRNQIVVGATDNRDCSALFSNYGTQVDIAAPGDSVLSLMPKNHYRTLSGTSQATPLIAGAIAMLWANEPELTHMQVKERLMYTADQLPQLSRWVRTSGRLNIENLLRNQAGQLLPKIPIHEVRVRDFHLETLHPFAKDQFHVWRFTFEGATAVRFRLAKFELDTFGDYLEIRDGTGRVIEKLNGVLPDNSFTNWVYSESVILEFSSNKSLQSYGFTIDGVETLENPQL